MKVRPRKSLRLQTLIPKAEPVAMPVQGLDLRAPPVHKDKERSLEQIQPERLLNHRAQAIDRLPEIDRHLAQKHLCDVAPRMHQRAPADKANNQPGSGNDDISKRSPELSTNEQAPPERLTNSGATRIATNC